MKSSPISRLLGVPLEWYHSKGHGDALALVTVSNGKEERTALISSTGFMLVTAKDYVIAPKERAVASKTPVKSAIHFGLKTVGWSMVALFLATSALTFAKVIDTRVVLTGSMVPTINPGDVIFTAPVSRISPKINDVVVYSGKRFDGTPVAPFAHRIIGGSPLAGFEMKGDANTEADVQRPKPSEIEGVVFLKVPFVGKLLQPQTMMLLLLSGFGVWLIIGAFRDEE
jgi:signal peptidase I